MFKNNRNLFIIALVALVNALGYGIIIPVLYSYSTKFGLSDFQNGLLFALFSVCQFISTPIIGRMSDKYGRKPLLIISIAGTALSFFIMAFAPSAIFLVIARALDGITAGNIPVASAVISDTTSTADRAKGFGIMGAAFGFGFIFGPAISALTVGISPALPFIIAGSVAVFATILTALLLPETNKHIGEVKHGKLFDLPHMARALTDKNTGITLLITLIYSAAFSMFIYAFQPFSVKILKLTPNTISFIFTILGLVGLISQIFIIARATKKFGLKKTFSTALLLLSLIFFIMFGIRSTIPFIFITILLAFANAPTQPLIQTIISRETDDRSQGTMLGLNASYMSIGQILGPIAGGALASIVIPFPFMAAGFCILGCFILSFRVLRPGVHKEQTF